MSRVIRARYEGGVLRPLEPLDLSEGEEAVLEIRERSGGRGVARFYGILGRRGRRGPLGGEEEYYDYVSERGCLSRH